MMVFCWKWQNGINTVSLSFPNNIFHKGDFVFSSSLFSKNEKKEDIFYDIYHSSEKQMSFRVIPSDKKNGIIVMNHEWKNLDL